jgi:surfactin synthase thioesterase subunit
MPNDEWFVPLVDRPGARARLFVFPHAGAGPSAARALAEALPDTIEASSLSLPGRQARAGEPPATDLTALMTRLAAAFRAQDKPYAFFGSCGGALLALLAAGGSAPGRLFVSGFAAPDVALIPRRLHRFPSARFWDAVLDQGGVPPELAVDELRDVFEPALRADFALYSQFHDAPGRLPLPVHVLRGSRDTTLSRGSLLGWRRAGTGYDLTEIDGGHWLLVDAATEVASWVAGSMDRAGE